MVRLLHKGREWHVIVNDAPTVKFRTLAAAEAWIREFVRFDGPIVIDKRSKGIGNDCAPGTDRSPSVRK